ncbi:MAG TPA: class I SAM-dependent methyltransferase, partial [Pseudolabrys sp.]|nr:class I SAM-dependent methyltransferase [Pseudolabrys sp.]
MPESEYVLGHSERELARLERQALVYAGLTRDSLRRAGIAPGMQVLDIGCGTGDVAFLAAETVGASGSVLAVDRAPAALDLARRRAEKNGVRNVRFQQGELGSLALDGGFDAIVGRLVVVYMSDPVASLRPLLRALRPGGILLLIEMDISSGTTVPLLPLFNRAMSWIRDVYARMGLEPETGSHLHALLRALDLEPEMIGVSLIEGGLEAGAYDYLAETVRSVAPAAEKFGIASAEEMTPDTLAERMRSEATPQTCIVYP